MAAALRAELASLQAQLAEKPPGLTAWRAEIAAAAAIIRQGLATLWGKRRS